MNKLRHHFHHHIRFYGAAAAGIAVWAAMTAAGGSQALAAAADAFFLIYLGACLAFLLGHTTGDLKQRAARQDEGILIVVAITLTAIAVNLTGVFLALNGGGHLRPGELALLLAAAPLGWFALHTIAAFHYANLFYFDPPGDEGPGQALQFPGTPEPDLWDFLYFSFVIGMTAQVSDVQIASSRMRRAALGHGIVSFFFNTVLIALVVNTVLAH
jgi:uncharacterized membrane protein